MSLQRLLPFFLRIALVLSVIVSGVAFAVDCHEIAVTQATGYGVFGEASDRQQTEAVTEALANAIAQVRGVFVEQRTDLKEAYQTTLRNDTMNITDTTELSHVIRTRSSGLVVDYRVENQTTEAGVLRVDLSATICLDPRILVDWAGPASAKSAFEGALREVLEPTGWAIVTAASFSPSEVVEASLATGATHVITVALTANDVGKWQGLRRVDTMVAVNLHDVLGHQLLRAASRGGTSVGRTTDEATASAARDLARSIGGDLVRALAGSAPQRTMTIRFGNARRPNTYIELRDELQRIPGVIDVAVGQGNDGILDFTVQGSTDACAVSAEIVQTRRMLLRELNCTDSYAALEVLRE